MIKEIIEMLIILLIGTNTNQPKYDLRRKVKPSFSAKFYSFVGRHLNIILPVVIVLSLIAFILFVLQSLEYLQLVTAFIML